MTLEKPPLAPTDLILLASIKAAEGFHQVGDVELLGDDQAKPRLIRAGCLTPEGRVTVYGEELLDVCEDLVGRGLDIEAMRRYHSDPWFAQTCKVTRAVLERQHGRFDKCKRELVLEAAALALIVAERAAEMRTGST